MKIDFHTVFPKINQLLHRPEQPAAVEPVKQSFDKTLGDISPEQVEKTAQNAISQQATQRAPLDTPRAMVNLNSFELEIPAPLPELLQPLGIEQSGDIKPSETGVKTPTVVRVRRVGADELAALPRNQRMEEVEKLVSRFGQSHGIDPLLGMAVVSAESSFNPLAVSRDGHESKGLFQLLDTTGKDLLERASLARGYEPFDPEQNVNLGVFYLRYLHDIFNAPTALPNNMSTIPAANSASLEKLAVAAFNAGEGRVASAQNRALGAGKDPSLYEQVASYLPESTRQYVERVMRFKNEHEA